MDTPILSVIVPVFNEAATVTEIIQRLLNTPYPKQVVVVNDGSTDSTRDARDRWQDCEHVEVLHHEVNRGEGVAMRTGIGYATGRLTILKDFDVGYDLRDYPELILPPGGANDAKQRRTFSDASVGGSGKS